MAQVSVSLPADGTTADVSDYNTPINTIVTDYNGNIDNSNIAAAAAIAGSKLADGSITNAKLSTTAGELGGVWLDYTPTIVGFSANPTNSVYRYTRVGKTVSVFVRQGTAGTSNSTSFTISLPVTAATITNAAWEAITRVSDNGGALQAGAVNIASSGTTMTLFSTVAGGGWTASGTKRAVSFIIQYETA